jgi:hypothetical protein
VLEGGLQAGEDEIVQSLNLQPCDFVIPLTLPAREHEVVTGCGWIHRAIFIAEDMMVVQSRSGGQATPS